MNITITDADLHQLLNPTPEEGKTQLHYYSSLNPHRPALCGAMPEGGSWKSDSHYRPGAKAYTAPGKLAPQFELCPGCQVRRSFMFPRSGGVQ